MAALDFSCTASSDDIESENHDRLMALYHIGTDVKRSLLHHYLSKKNLNLANYLSKRYDCIPSDDVKRVTRTKNIQLSDLGIYTIDTLLMNHCYDLYWDCCLDKSSLENILYTNNTELYRLYQNDLQYGHESPNDLQKLKRVSNIQWALIIGKRYNQTSTIFPKEGLEVTAFDDDMNFVLLSTVCPLYKSVQVVTENQMKISRIAVEHGINNDDYEKIWELMEKKLNIMSIHCNCAGYFMLKLDTIKKSTFNREKTRDNRRYILDSTFGNPKLLKDAEFVDRVQNELKLIKEEETKSLVWRHCERKISFSLENGKYIPGSYPSALADFAKKDLECCQSVCSRLNVHQKPISTSDKIDVLGQQKIIDRNHYLKLVYLIQEVAKQVLVDVLKGRLPGADFGNALKGMKERLLPSLNDDQKQKIYPEGSKYNGDLSDMDVSLLYIILRKLNTICEHKNGWGKDPEKDDRSISANIDRIRIAKNMIVSHPSNCSMESTEFNKRWEAIRQCCVDLGGNKYEEKIDMLLTSSLDCDRAQKVTESLENERENDNKNEKYARKLEEMLDSVKLLCDTFQRNIKCTEGQKTTHNTKSGTLIRLKIEGDQLPSTADIGNRFEHYNNEDVSVKSVEDGCLMITLEMFSSAFQGFGYFLAVIDKLLQNIFPARAVSVDKSGKVINISVKLYQLVEECKWHPPDLEDKNTKRNTVDNTREIAKSTQDALKFSIENFSSAKENYDILLSVFHIGTEVKRCLLETYLHEKKVELIEFLTNLNQTYLTFADVKRSIRRSSTIRLPDLALSTIDILLRFNCFDMFWDCCLLDTSLEDVLNSHKEVLYRIYQNSIRQKHLPSISTENYTPSLTKTQWEILFKSGESSGIKGDGNVADISATKDITLSSLDETLNVLLLYTVCPLFQSVNSVSECQIQILKIAVLNSECKRLSFENLWNRIESHIISIAAHCKLSDYFKRKCETTKGTCFNKTLSQENRKYILEDAFNNPDLIRNKQFCNRVRKELDIISVDDNLNLARKLCGKEIPILLVDGKYTKGAYSLSEVENADKDLQVIKSVCSNQVMEADQMETEDEMQADDIQKRINKHSHLKVVQLITNISKDVLVDVLKVRLPGANFGYAFNGMKKKILPQLNNYGRQLLYPDGSSYSGDLSDLDISLIYTILRNINTIAPQLNGWGNMPKDNDRSLSANIDRIRIFKNKYVSRCSNLSLDEQDFLQTWQEIRQCIIQLGGDDYMRKIDSLLTTEINPVMEKELCNTIRRLKEADRQNELNYDSLKEDIHEIKQHLRMTNKPPTDTATASNGSLDSVLLELRIEGENIPLVEEIKKRTNDLSSDDMRITFVKEGSIIICLKVSPSALYTVGNFLGMIDTLLSKLLQMYSHYGNGHTTHIVASVNFMDEQNEPIGFPMKQNLVSTTGLQKMADTDMIEMRMEESMRELKMDIMMMRIEESTRNLKMIMTLGESTRKEKKMTIEEGKKTKLEMLNRRMLNLTKLTRIKTSTEEPMTDLKFFGSDTLMHQHILKLKETSSTKTYTGENMTDLNIFDSDTKNKATALSKTAKFDEGSEEKHEEYRQQNIPKVEPK